MDIFSLPNCWKFVVLMVVCKVLFCWTYCFQCEERIVVISRQLVALSHDRTIHFDVTD
jgi:hypothetical protein